MKLLPLIWLLLAGTAHAGHWTFAPPAAYHANAVTVQVGNARGSGIYCQYGEMRGVLTAAHVVQGSQQARVTFPDGTTQSGGYRVDKSKADVAFIFAGHSTLEPLVIAAATPQRGDRVEFLGYGGPSGKTLRPFYGTWTAATMGDMNIIDAKPVSGDSGAGVVNASGEVVTVQSVGTGGSVGSDSGFAIYAMSGCPKPELVRAFVERVYTQYCPNGQCQIPQGSNGGMYPQQQGGALPQTTPGDAARGFGFFRVQQSPQQQQQPVYQQPVQVGCDAETLRRLADLERRQSGDDANWERVKAFEAAAREEWPRIREEMRKLNSSTVEDILDHVERVDESSLKRHAESMAETQKTFEAQTGLLKAQQGQLTEVAAETSKLGGLVGGFKSRFDMLPEEVQSAAKSAAASAVAPVEARAAAMVDERLPPGLATALKDWYVDKKEEVKERLGWTNGEVAGAVGGSVGLLGVIGGLVGWGLKRGARVAAQSVPGGGLVVGVADALGIDPVDRLAAALERRFKRDDKPQ